jgi:hypothetical protein
MAQQKKPSPFCRWYEKNENKQRLSEKRKKRYAEDPEYRQRALEASRRRRQGKPNLPRPADAQISFAEAAERTGRSVPTLHVWRRKKYFPEPKHYGGRLCFNENQVLQLTKLKEVIRVYRNRRGNVKRGALKEAVSLIAANWE